MRQLTEEQWLRTVTDLAAAYGWRDYHVRKSSREVLFKRSGRRAWVSDVSVQGKGFPDLVLVRAKDARLIFAELKSGDGRLMPEQRVWLDDLGVVAQRVAFVVGIARSHHAAPIKPQFEPRVEVFVWRPTDYDAVERALR